MDNDGDDDLICGDRNGFIYYFERENGELYLKDTLFELVSGANTIPEVTDWNNDGKMDLLVTGIQTYHDYAIPIYIFLNIGKNSFEIDTSKPDSIDAPLLDSIDKYRYFDYTDLDNDGLNDLVVGHYKSTGSPDYETYSKIRWSKNKGTAEAPLFDDYQYLTFDNDTAVGLTTFKYFNLPFFTFYDYNKDGIKDMVYGASLFKGDLWGDKTPEKNLIVWYGHKSGTGVSFKSQKPNSINVIITNKHVVNKEFDNAVISIYNLKGQRVFRAISGKNITVELPKLRGVYEVVVSVGGRIVESMKVTFR